MDREKKICKVPGCDYEARAKGFCISHYYIAKKYGDEYSMNHKIAREGAYGNNPEFCKYPGCSDRHYAKGYCSKHYQGFLLRKSNKGEYKESDQRSYKKDYHIYRGMMDRCYNRNNASYINYGGRGITVCARWIESCDNFFADMGKRPGREYSLDRINNDGNYEPSNCRWATNKTQMRNRRSVKLNAEKVALIKAMLLSGVQQSFLARIFDVRPDAITRIKQGRIWADIEPCKLITNSKPVPK